MTYESLDAGAFACASRSTAIRGGICPRRRASVQGDGPGPNPASAVTFEERNKSAQYLDASGDWALFKLVGKGQCRRADPEHFRLTLSKDSHRVVVVIDALRVNNVFAGLSALHGFRCGG